MVRLVLGRSVPSRIRVRVHELCFHQPRGSGTQPARGHQALSILLLCPCAAHRLYSASHGKPFYWIVSCLFAFARYY